MPHKKLVEEGGEAYIDFAKLKNYFTEGGQAVIPVVVQDVKSQQVLMLAYADQEALEATLRNGEATFYSTSRNKLWVKGELSGNTLLVKQVKINCEQNSLLYLVEPIRDYGACHTIDNENKIRKDGLRRISCFYRSVAINSDKTGLELVPDQLGETSWPLLELPKGRLLRPTLMLFKKIGLGLRFFDRRYARFDLDGKMIFDSVGVSLTKNIPQIVRWSGGSCGIASLESMVKSGLQNNIIEVARLDYGKLLKKPAIVLFIASERYTSANTVRTFEQIGKMLEQALLEEDNS